MKPRLLGRTIAILLTSTLAVTAASSAMAAAAPLRVRMLLVGPDTAEYASHRNGAVLGQTEGNIQGRFLGIEYVLDAVSVEEALQGSADVSAVIVADGREPLMRLLEHYAPLHVPVFNITLADMDLIEVNEAFAPQYKAVEKELGLDPAKTNVDGGAIAITHPLAASGARITIHLLHALRRTGGRYGLGSACIGGGQGGAVIVEAL